MDNSFELTNNNKGLTLDNLRELIKGTRKLSGDIPIVMDYNINNNSTVKICIVNHIYNNIIFSN